MNPWVDPVDAERTLDNCYLTVFKNNNNLRLIILIYLTFFHNLNRESCQDV